MPTGKKLVITAGERFGKLVVVGEAEKLIQPSGQTQRAIICKCDCGNTTTVRLSHLIRGRITSCDCNKHGESGTPLHNVWRSMKERATNPNHNRRYVQKGIKICQEWSEYKVFRQWALNNGYKEGLQIDRKNNNGNYEPSNCRFVNNIQNVNNRDVTKFINYKGRHVAFMILLREKGLIDHMRAISARINRGWSAERAIDTPIKKGNYRNNGFNYQWKKSHPKYPAT